MKYIIYMIDHIGEDWTTEREAWSYNEYSCRNAEETRAHLAEQFQIIAGKPEGPTIHQPIMLGKWVLKLFIEDEDGTQYPRYLVAMPACRRWANMMHVHSLIKGHRLQLAIAMGFDITAFDFTAWDVDRAIKERGIKEHRAA